MDQREPYIKLSVIRDYGLNRDSEDVIFRKSELDGLSIAQLRGFREILEDEIDDIDYQIAHEQKHMEHDAAWHYGAKASKKARMDFMRHIDKILEKSSEPSELESLRAFRSAADLVLNEETIACIQKRADSLDDCFVNRGMFEVD